jgi:hypothetical protein
MRLRHLFVSTAILLAAIAAHAADRAAVRTEILKLLGDLGQPAFVAPEEGKAWLLQVEGEAFGQKGKIELGWDSHARHYVKVDVGGLAKATAVFGEKESWLYLPDKKKVFAAAHPAPEGSTLLADCKVWPLVTARVPVLLGAAMFIPIPEDVKLDKKEDGTILINDGGDLNLEIHALGKDGALSIHSKAHDKGNIEVRKWAQVPAAEFEAQLSRPSGAEVENVEIEHLRGMLATTADFAGELILRKVSPDDIPQPLANVPKVDGTPVIRFKGAPEEMGTQHGTLLKEAVNYNMRRTLHGVGLASTLSTGKWFPSELANAWKVQEQYIPERYVREIDAMSVAAGIPKEWGRSVSVFPELFHCSGLALRGKATVDGRLYHGRVLDYMTEIGLQNTAVVMVFEPEGRNAWMSMGYAGLCSTVTAMNDKGLSMGEMGGRGEGYLDGMPMSLMMREVVERFDSAKDALAWMKSTPRTCEYYYVITDAKTKTMAGIASLSKKLAAEKGKPDFRVIDPGSSCEELPNAIEDAVLMSAGDRYSCLVDRVKKDYGKVDMQGAWDMLRGGVAMKSNLHTVLFSPETLDFWAAQAGPDGQPAYTQKVSKFNLKKLLAEEKLTQTTDSGALPKVR